MNLLLPEPPQASVSVLGDTLSALAARGQFSGRALKRARAEQLSITAPHEVYTIGLDQLRERPTLRAAQPSGWRYLVEVDERVVAAAEVSTTGPDAHQFAHINHGPFVDGTVRAMAVAEAATNDEDAEARLLNIPALYFMGILLRPTDGKAEYIVPIAPAPEGIETDRAYPASELLDELSRRAQAIPDLPEGDQSGG